MTIFYLPQVRGDNIMGKDTPRLEEIKSFYASHPLDILIGRRGGWVEGYKKYIGGGVGTLRSDTN